jgi:mono/diheme cytochrome c family protein
MVYQQSIHYEEGPRLAAPAEAVPIQGPAAIANQPGSAPIPVGPNSLQRGQILFDLHCALCHNETGKGDGRLSGYFNPRPRDLTGDQVKGMSDQQIYMTITNGFGLMPSIREDLSAVERWDVVNWVRELQKR